MPAHSTPSVSRTHLDFPKFRSLKLLIKIVVFVFCFFFFKQKTAYEIGLNVRWAGAEGAIGWLPADDMLA